MNRYYVCCNEKNREKYMKKIREYFNIVNICGDMEDATDILVLGEIEDEKRISIGRSGKKIHYMNEELLPSDKNKIERFL